MADEIRRFWVNWGEEEFEEAEDGELVKHDDHLKAIEETRKQVIAKVEEALNRAMYVNEGDSPEILDAALASVKWHGDAPYADELQHAIGTFVGAALATLQGGTDV